MTDGLSLKQLVEVATKVQRTLCAYDGGPTGNREPPSTCDCKYGADKIASGGECGNGCPEMREIATLLKEMKPKEFKAIRNRLFKKAAKKVRKMNKAWEKQRNKLHEDRLSSGAD